MVDNDLMCIWDGGRDGRRGLPCQPARPLNGSVIFLQPSPSNALLMIPCSLNCTRTSPSAEPFDYNNEILVLYLDVLLFRFIVTINIVDIYCPKALDFNLFLIDTYYAHGI